MNFRRVFFIMMCIIFSYFLTQRLESEPIERLMIQPGVGFDIEREREGKGNYRVTISSYVFQGENNVISEEYSTVAPTVPLNREKRQLQANKRFIVGFEKVYIIGEEQGRYGINMLLDILQKNPWVNDNGYIMVCKGKAEEIMNTKIKGYPSSSDYLYGLIQSSKSHNFFSKKYSLINALQQVDAEGYNLVLPYIEKKEDKIQITGLVLFNKDKMVEKISIEDARILNMLREDKVTGILEIQENSFQYASYNTVVKNHTTCHKENGRYKFAINLNFEGTIISNELYPSMLYDKNSTVDFQKEMSSKITAMCEKFIDKMQREYKVDALNLGKIAVAKYGRHSGQNWNKIISEAKIDVNVKVKITKNDRGDY